eukprot:TRINITY_DN1428_c0_g1_i2.p1 TRINITY_DN1428_c0_g1~~TRINITY_DN1428_c0_g1_i2.p1  ORF type:complete len:1082 (+),score=325.48 TRINITY_DN1428_c0_g1_i2:1206-4451(+)
MGVNDLRSMHSRRRPMSASSVPTARLMPSLPHQHRLGVSGGVSRGGLSGRTSAFGQQMSGTMGNGSRPVSSMSVGSQRSNTSRVEVKSLLDRAAEGQKIGGTSGNMIVARVLGQVLDRLVESDMFSDPIGIYVRRFGLDALVNSISSKDLDVRNRALEILTVLPWAPGDAEEFFRKGGVEPLVDAISLQDEKGCVLALQSLRTVLVNDDICHCVLEIDGLEKVLSVLGRTSLDETRCDALLVLIALVFTHAGKVLLRRAGGIRDTIRFLSFKKTDVVRLAFHLFMIISSDPDNRVEVRNAGAIPVIIRQMHSDDIEVRRSAAAIALNLSVNEINKETLRDAGALPRLVELLSCDDYDTQEFAVRSIANMCIHMENRNIIFQLGAVEPVLELLDAMSDTAVRFAIRVTLYLSYVDEARDEIVSNTENMERFLAVLNHRDVRIVQEGLVCLEVLCRNPDTLQYVEELDYTPVLIRILHKSLQEDQGGVPSTDTMDERVHTMMRKVILRVLARVSLSPEEIGLLLKLDVVHDLFPLVNEADANGSFPLRWEIVNLLAILSHADEFATVLRSSEYCVRVVIDCLALDDEFIGFSLRIMQNTCKDAEVKTLMAHNGAINAITGLFDEENMTFFKDGVLVLQFLSTAPFEYLQSIDDRLVDAMIQRLDASASDDDMKKACLVTMRNLSVHPAFGDLLLKLDAARMVRNVLENAEEDEERVLDALVLIKNVSHLESASDAIHRAALIPAVVKCLTSSNESHSHHALNMLHTVAQFEQLHEMFLADEGLLTYLEKTLLSGKVRERIKCATIVWHIGTSVNAEQPFDQFRIVRAVLSCLSGVSQTAELTKTALQTLFPLSELPILCKTIIQLGGVSLLLKSAAEGPVPSRVLALYVIWNLCQYGNAAEELEKRGGLSVIVDCFGNDELEIASIALKILTQIIEYETVARIVVQKNGILVLQRILQHGTDEMRMDALFCVEYVARMGRTHFLQTTLLETIVSIHRRLSGDVRQMASETLLYLGNDASFEAKIAAANVIDPKKLPELAGVDYVHNEGGDGAGKREGKTIVDGEENGDDEGEAVEMGPEGLEI